MASTSSASKTTVPAPESSPTTKTIISGVDNLYFFAGVCGVAAIIILGTTVVLYRMQKSKKAKPEQQTQNMSVMMNHGAQGNTTMTGMPNMPLMPQVQSVWPQSMLRPMAPLSSAPSGRISANFGNNTSFTNWQNGARTSGMGQTTMASSYTSQQTGASPTRTMGQTRTLADPSMQWSGAV
jgi:hypothetical protein